MKKVVITGTFRTERYEDVHYFVLDDISPVIEDAKGQTMVPTPSVVVDPSLQNAFDAADLADADLGMMLITHGTVRVKHGTATPVVWNRIWAKEAGVNYVVKARRAVKLRGATQDEPAGP